MESTLAVGLLSNLAVSSGAAVQHLLGAGPVMAQLPMTLGGGASSMAPSGLYDSVTRSFWGPFLLIIGILGILLSTALLVATRSERSAMDKAAARQQAKAKPTPKPAASPAAATAPPTPAPAPAPRPRATSEHLFIAFPGIEERHPDVWDPKTPLAVGIHVRNPTGQPHEGVIRLTRVQDGRTETLAEAQPDAQGIARMSVTIGTAGESDLVATLIIDGREAGQTVRAIRIVSYRAEIVETFEDFKAWATTHHEGVDPKHTAREFVDRFADARPGVPTDPLERIVALYELANYSEHPVGRAAYLRLVDAFLELEHAGALDAAEESVAAA